MTDLDRRSFLKRGGLFAGAALASTTALGRLDAHAAWAKGGRGPMGGAGGRGRGDGRTGLGGYGELSRRTAVNEAAGPEYLALPAGFSYVVFGKLGELMTDGTPTPRNLDGMGAFARPDGSVRLIRNHENRNAPGDPSLGVMVAPGDVSKKYDPLAFGGTTTLDVDVESMRLVRDFVSCAGTTVNCAGGLMLGDAGWLTCEETVTGPDSPFPGAARFSQEHGYNFIVPVAAEGATFPQPLRAMGRFAHEAVATDPRTGVVYETEDAGNESGFYRFLPSNPNDLTAGGRLQMLGIEGIDRYDTTRGQAVGRELPVRWIDIPDPDPNLEGGARKVAGQGLDRGAASFNRLEGIWWEGDHCFFASTSGGNAMQGQVWEYRTALGNQGRGNSNGRGRGPNPDGAGTLTLAYESTGFDPNVGRSPLDSPDNLNITPRGGVLLCEDDSNAAPGSEGDTHPLAPGITDVNRLIGLGDDGFPFEFAVNTLNGTEFAGACFAPNAPEVLFVNIFGDGTPGSGATLAVTGPWGNGAL